MGNALGIERRVFPGLPDANARRDLEARFGSRIVVDDDCAVWTSDAPGSDPLHVVCFHGNMEDVSRTIGGWIERTGATRVTAFEYPGYGWRVGETPTERGIAEGAREMAKRVTEGERVVVCGRSIGTYAALELAVAMGRKKCAGLVLLSPLLSAVSTVVPPGIFQRALRPVDVANNGDLATRLDPDIGVFIAHGTQDAIVPINNGRALCALMKHVSDVRFLPIDGAKHNDLVRYDKFKRLLSKFLNELF
jgi:pimeloyl-ACP methyl ester carboxylesterase